MKRSKLLFIAGILGTAYFIYIAIYFFGNTISSETGLEAVSNGLATAIVMPHMVCVGLAVIFNWIGWVIKARWGALTAGILYAASMVFMFLYAVCVLVQTILCFVAFALMKKNSDLSNSLERKINE